MIDLEIPATPGEPESVSQARAYFYGETETLGALPEEVAEALITALVRREDVAKLTALAGGKDKAMAKRARRGLHLLRSRGRSVEVPRPAATPRVAPVATAEEGPLSLASVPVSDGEQLIWLALASADGVDIFQGMVQDDRGLYRFEAMHTARKHWRNTAQGFLALNTTIIAPVPASYARWRLEEAVARTVALGRTPPREYAEFRRAMGPVEVPSPHPVEELVPASAVAEAAAQPHLLATALDLPELRTWTPPDEELQRLWLRVNEIATSRLIIDAQQRADQQREVASRAAREAWETPLRARLAERLRESAYLVARRAPVGPRGRDYLGDAALILAASRRLADPAATAEDDVVLRHLYERFVARIPAGESAAPAPETERPGGLILPPE
ncbi:MAG TPA: hypothetical protein VH877_03775 [Polyangia bacterium]|jgi:hypothetical protein|nr:hypothetical protein [Polyangia bacterium]